MIVLALETATDLLGVAVVDERRVLASYEVLAERPHAIELPSATARVLKAAGLTFGQLDGIAVDIGPGSFTGLRIGIAFLKAMLFKTPKPLIGVPSLDVLAAGAALSSGTVCPVIDAKQKKVYGGVYKADGSVAARQADYTLAPVQQFIEQIPKGPVLLLGDGATLYRDALLEALGKRARFGPPELAIPRAATVGRLGIERLAKNLRDDPATVVPMYLYPMDCAIRPSTRPPAAPRSTVQAEQRQGE